MKQIKKFFFLEGESLTLIDWLIQISMYTQINSKRLIWGNKFLYSANVLVSRKLIHLRYKFTSSVLYDVKRESIKSLSLMLHMDNWKHLVFRYRSSRLEVFSKKDVLKHFAKFTEKHLCQSIFFNKVAGIRPAVLTEKETLARVFSCEFS